MENENTDSFPRRGNNLGAVDVRGGGDQHEKKYRMPNWQLKESPPLVWYKKTCEKYQVM